MYFVSVFVLSSACHKPAIVMCISSFSGINKDASNNNKMKRHI